MNHRKKNVNEDTIESQPLKTSREEKTSTSTSRKAINVFLKRSLKCTQKLQGNKRIEAEKERRTYTRSATGRKEGLKQRGLTYLKILW